MLDDLLADWQAGTARRAGGAGRRPPLLARVARAEGLPGAQPRAVPLARRRAGPRGAGAAGRGGRRRRDAAGAGVPRRGRHDRAVQPRGRGRLGHAHPGRGAVLRPGGRRRRARRAGGGGVRRVRGPADRAGRARGAGRPGRPELADRELPGLPRRPVGRRPGPPRDRAGPALRRGAAVGDGRDAPRAARPGADDRASTAATRSPPTPWWSRPACSTGGSAAPGGDELSRAAASTTAARAREALACEGEQVFVVGGANSAGQAALYFAQHAAAGHDRPPRRRPARRACPGT